MQRQRSLFASLRSSFAPQVPLRLSPTVPFGPQRSAPKAMPVPTEVPSPTSLGAAQEADGAL